MMRATILGSGTSSGVPRIGNDWGDCDPADPRNRARTIWYDELADTLMMAAGSAIFGNRFVRPRVLKQEVNDAAAGQALSAIAREEDLNGRIRRNVMDTRRAESPPPGPKSARTLPKTPALRNVCEAIVPFHER